MATDYRSVPGLYTGNTFQTRQVVRSVSSKVYYPSLAILDGSLSRDVGSVPTSLLRAGMLLGKVTTGGKYRPSIIGLTNGAITAGAATSVTVPAAVATEAARLIAVAAGTVNLRIFGPPTAAGTNAATTIPVTAASGTTLTITSTTLPAYVDKSLIQATDGSQNPVTILEDQDGIDVNDIAGTNIDQTLGLFLKGADIYASMVIAGNNALTDLDASLQTFVKQQLNGGGTNTRGLFTFDSELP